MAQEVTQDYIPPTEGSLAVDPNRAPANPARILPFPTIDGAVPPTAKEARAANTGELAPGKTRGFVESLARNWAVRLGLVSGGAWAAYENVPAIHEKVDQLKDRLSTYLRLQSSNSANTPIIAPERKPDLTPQGTLQEFEGSSYIELASPKDNLAERTYGMGFNFEPTKAMRPDGSVITDSQGREMWNPGKGSLKGFLAAKARDEEGNFMFAVDVPAEGNLNKISPATIPTMETKNGKTASIKGIRVWFRMLPGRDERDARAYLASGASWKRSGETGPGSTLGYGSEGFDQYSALGDKFDSVTFVTVLPQQFSDELTRLRGEAVTKEAQQFADWNKRQMQDLMEDPRGWVADGNKRFLYPTGLRLLLSR